MLAAKGPRRSIGTGWIQGAPISCGRLCVGVGVWVWVWVCGQGRSAACVACSRVMPSVHVHVRAGAAVSLSARKWRASHIIWTPPTPPTCKYMPLPLVPRSGPSSSCTCSRPESKAAKWQSAYHGQLKAALPYSLANKQARKLRA